mmetsp:Transcript_13480/g.42094  ORF Transcript_13480/g.42094 Transcript_13480/m.42094 type:complete len:388 (+) Transcript_13480:575-1738(+)
MLFKLQPHGIAVLPACSQAFQVEGLRARREPLVGAERAVNRDDRLLVPRRAGAEDLGKLPNRLIAEALGQVHGRRLDSGGLPVEDERELDRGLDVLLLQQPGHAVARRGRDQPEGVRGRWERDLLPRLAPAVGVHRLYHLGLCLVKVQGADPGICRALGCNLQAHRELAVDDGVGAARKRVERREVQDRPDEQEEQQEQQQTPEVQLLEGRALVTGRDERTDLHVRADSVQIVLGVLEFHPHEEVQGSQRCRPVREDPQLVQEGQGAVDAEAHLREEVGALGETHASAHDMHIVPQLQRAQHNVEHVKDVERDQLGVPGPEQGEAQADLQRRRDGEPAEHEDSVEDADVRHQQSLVQHAHEDSHLPGVPLRGRLSRRPAKSGRCGVA